jgi:type VI secretion system protein VasG
MSTQALRALIGKLNDPCRQALEGAIGLCVARTQPTVELEHYLLKLCAAQDSDVLRVLRRFNIDLSTLTRELTRSLDRTPGGSAGSPTLSRRIPLLLREAWLCGSVEYGAQRVRSGHLLLALLRGEELGLIAGDIAPALTRIPVAQLQQELVWICKGSPEDEQAPAAEAGGAGMGRAGAPGEGGKLEQYTIDLVARARAGQLDPVLERAEEVQQVIDILTRRRQNNPILVGEAGVGKTAVVEGLALRIAAGDVPAPLQPVSLRILDLALLQAGAGVRGEFEARLKGVIDEVQASTRPVILFIDEAHTLIGAGGASGQGDAANLLKPALARGELRTIAATTWTEYKSYFEKDKALARRFQLVKVPEPTPEQAIVMVRGLSPSLEHHHKVHVLDEAVESAVRLSHRYVADRQLPDKAVSVLATAAARVALSQGATPPPIDSARQRIAALEAEAAALEREAHVGGGVEERLAQLGKVRAAEAERLAALEARWQEEMALCEELRGLVAGLSGKTPAERQEIRQRIQEGRQRLQAMQAEDPLVHAFVDGQTVASVVSAWTGVPLGRMVKDDIEAVLRLPSTLQERVIGQDMSLQAICQRVQTSRAGLEDRRKPLGVFLLVGPSGVGKTETALALAEALYGGERNLITINMSEYQESYTVSGLRGSPPGYVGSERGGILTEAVRRRPYSVVLLDEVEKAHPDVREIFYQVFDRGMLTDGTGMEVDFKNTLILMTANLGADVIHKLCADPETRPTAAALAEALRPALRTKLDDAFLGRTTVLPYFPLSDEVLRDIVRMQLGRIGRRLFENHRAALRYGDAVVDAIARRCTEVESGARNVDRILTRTVLPALAQELLQRMAGGVKVQAVEVTVDGKNNFVYQVI